MKQNVRHFLQKRDRRRKLGVWSLEFTVRRSLFAVHCSPFTVRRAEWSHATLTVNLTPPQKSRIANFESRICAELAVSNPFFKFNPQFAIRNPKLLVLCASVVNPLW
jgi:hypothetical protein